MVVGMVLNEAASHLMDMGASQGSMPEDCPMMSGVSSNKGESQGEGKTESRYQACQLCMSMAAIQDSAIKSPPLLPQPHVISRVERFASAELLRFIKPPIY